MQFHVTFAISPGADQILWEDTSNIITDFFLHPLEVQGTGELTYVGTTLHDLSGRRPTEDADYAIRLRSAGSENLRIDMRIRRQDASNFIVMKIDFAADVIQIVETIAGVETILDQASHNFKFLGYVPYIFEVWGVGRFIYGFVNGYNIVNASTETFRTEPGFSVNFPTFNSVDPPLLYTISAIETEEPPDPVSLLNDPGDILLTHRLDIKQQIENPTTRTWSTFVKAMKFYEEQRNFGMPDATWEELGYPIRKPSAEEWFANE